MRERLRPFRLGSILALILLCAKIYSAKLDLDLSSWITRTTRIENELKTIESSLGDGAGSQSLLLIQTPKKTNDLDSELATEDNNNELLSVKSFMIHMEALAIATQVTVDLHDVSWSFKDICLTPTHPDFENFQINDILDRLIPCYVKTPLDCFWEGSKLLGPHQDVRFSSMGPSLKWSTLNPQLLMHSQRAHSLQELTSWMRRAGIEEGYLTRPCLDPSDTNCPMRAPNKLTGEAPNIGYALNGGCDGFATKRMHWKEDELLGGIERNSTGYIVNAEAIQSTLLLMGERDMYDYWRHTDKVKEINNWSIDKAKEVLRSWQERYREELRQFERSSRPNNPFKIHALTPTSMMEPIDESTVLDYASFKYSTIIMSFVFCLLFPDMRKPNNHSNRTKQTLLALFISTIEILTYLASIGLSSFMNLPINMATTQILPPLALYLGFRQAFMVANVFANHYKKDLPNPRTVSTIIVECLFVVIPLIVATAMPVQATRVFTMQAIIFTLLSSIVSLSLLPTILNIYIDKIDRNSHTAQDVERPASEISVGEMILSRLQQDLEFIRSPGAANIDYVVDYKSTTPEPSYSIPDLLLRSDHLDLKKVEPMSQAPDKTVQIDDANESSDLWTTKAMNILNKNKSVQTLLIASKMLILVGMMCQAPKIRFGLHLSDIILQGTEEHDSLLVREKYFPVYNIFAITRGGLDYPSSQKLLYELHEKYSQVDGVLRDSEPKFWLSYFRDWLYELQETFDQERNQSRISKDGWTEEASDTAKLAFKLLAQTGKIDDPINKNLVETNRLVDKNGIINQKSFYYLLTAWVMNDEFSYSVSEADFKPTPKLWNEDANNLKIERARPLTYAQMPFIIKLQDYRDIMRSITEIRKISQSFESLGVYNFPTGIPFMFWDQFVHLDYLFFAALCIIIFILYVVVGLAYADFTVATVTLLPITTTIIEIYCLIGYLAIPFNSILGVMILALIGIMSTLTIQIITSYELSDGTVEDRVYSSMNQSFKSVIVSLILLTVTTMVFCGSRIDFMAKYATIMFYVLLTGAFNSFLLTPASLSLLGSERPDKRMSPVRMPSRSPAVTANKPPKGRMLSKRFCKQGRKKRGYPMVKSQISLSTISEESHVETRAPDLKLNISIKC